MIVAYDLDGVLAEGPKPSLIKWGKMNGAQRNSRKDELLFHYSNAKVLLQPEEPEFHVITARKNTEEVRAVTWVWLQMHFNGRVAGLHMLNTSRTVENVVQFKGCVLASLGAAEFTEDNWQVVRRIRKLGLNCKVWLYIEGQRTLSGAHE